MKPLILKMQAFGPYANIEKIDFSELGNRTMFVISGKTGSGKTTIFDAISYAIYGKASGEDRNGTDLRSQFSSEEVETEVSLEFALRNKRYHIIRAPQQERRKKSGEGTTIIGARAELYAWNDEGEKVLIASKINEVEEKIKEIMLIDSNQFRQILMIPQGEFRKLLTSDSKDKELILQRLFHTQIYKMIEEKLKNESTDLKKKVEDQIQARNEAIRRISVLVNEELRSLLEEGITNDTKILPLLKEEIDQLTRMLDERTLEVNRQKAARDLIIKQHAEAQAIVSQFLQKEEVQKKKVELEARKEEYVQKEATIRFAQKAALLAKQEELCHRLSSELKDAQKALDIGNEKLKGCTEEMEQKKLQLEKELGLETEREFFRNELQKLHNMKEDVYSFTEIAGILKETKNKLDSEKENLRKAEEALAGNEAKYKLLQIKQQESEKAKVTYLENQLQLDRFQNDLERLSKYASALETHEKLVKEAELASSQFEKASSRYLDARQLVEKLERDWLSGQASILAANLVSGDACPVCGSSHHPMPAHTSITVPKEDDLKSAKAQAGEIELTKSKAESVYFELSSRARGSEREVEGYYNEILKFRSDFKSEDCNQLKQFLMREMDQLTSAQKSLLQSSTLLEKILSDLNKLDEEKEGIKASLAAFSARISELTVSFAQQETQFMRMMKMVPENIRSADAYERSVKEARVKVDKQKALLEEAQQKYNDAREKYNTEQTRVEENEKLVKNRQTVLEKERSIFIASMHEQGFEIYKDYDHAKKTEGEIELIESDIRNYREVLRSVQDQYEQLSKTLKNITIPDLDKLQAKIAESGEMLAGLENEQRDLFMKRRDNQEILSKVEAINAAMKENEHRYRLVGHLYEISKGQNTYRITFERFVLASFLDDILREANGRLLKMTGGRYQLLRKTDRAKGNAQSGLELLVYDQYTGQERHVKTLSGGESFKAALALALGLADVVQNYAGGVSLETMFIDEGFGTLDPESLDQAIESLIEIQSSGRLVGIISHVPELKERIDARLEVNATQTGSQTEFVFTN